MVALSKWRGKRRWTGRFVLMLIKDGCSEHEKIGSFVLIGMMWKRDIASSR